ncbi:MAG: hypothetical protein AAFV54_05965 [Pseudomonadota bacterium]
MTSDAKMINVTVDITGFYFEKNVVVPATATVQEVMDAVQAETRGTEMQLTYTPRPGGSKKFLRAIEVLFDPARGGVPQSRQIRNPGSTLDLEKPFPQATKYFYDDGFRPPVGPQKEGFADFTLAWQYYVFDEAKRLKSSGPKGQRVILPFANSAAQPGGITLAHNDRIVWRLVAIFGVPLSENPATGEGGAVSGEWSEGGIKSES